MPSVHATTAFRVRLSATEERRLRAYLERAKQADPGVNANRFFAEAARRELDRLEAESGDPLTGGPTT